MQGGYVMKFTDGLWTVKEGYTLEYPKEIADIDYSDAGITLLAPYTAQERRADAVGCGLLSVHISAIGANMFSVKISNHKGSRAAKAVLELNEAIIKPLSSETEDEYIYSSSLLEVHFNKSGDWGISFYYSGRLLTSSELGGMAHITAPDGSTYIREQFTLSEGECIYGLGEVPGSIVRNGGSYNIWNEDAGVRYGSSAKSVPFIISSRGYGVFVNSTECVSYEIGNDCTTATDGNVVTQRTQISLSGETMEYIFIGGASMKHVLDIYSELIGRPMLPPAWSFGSWLSAPKYGEFDEDSVLSMVEFAKNMNAPLSVIHLSPCWMKDFEWTSFLWDEQRFPNPQHMIKKLHEQGIRICLTLTPYISQRSPQFQEGFDGNYFVNLGNGDMFQTDHIQAGSGLVDFSNLVARAWYQKFVDDLIRMGVDSFQLDYGADAPIASPAYGVRAASQGITYKNELDPVSMHNLYPTLFSEAVFEVLERRYGQNNAFLLAHAGFAGSQKFSCLTLDNEDASYAGMQASLQSGLSLSISGFPYWSENITGLADVVTPDLYMRWHQAAMFLPHATLGGLEQDKTFWSLGPEALEETLTFAKFKLGLMPYIFSCAVESSSLGIPMTRPMILEFPEDPNTAMLDQQFMFGPSILVAPITSEDGIVRYYVPSGTWTNLMTRERIEGPIWKNEQHSYSTMPLLARPGTILVAGTNDEKPVYSYTENATITLFEIPEGKEISTDVYSSDLKNVGYVKVLRQNNRMTISTQGLFGTIRLLLAGVFRIASCSSGIPEINEWGSMIQFSGNEVTVELA